MTYVHRWYWQLDAQQVVVSVGQPKKRHIEVSNSVLLLNGRLKYLYLTVSKSRQGPDRKIALQAKAEKHNLKALRTKYRTNPDAFDDEPTELLSEIDRDEDIMVSFLFFYVLRRSQPYNSFHITVYLWSRRH